MTQGQQSEYHELLSDISTSRPSVNQSSLFGDPPKFLSQEACLDIVQRILKCTTGVGSTGVNIRSRWRGDIRWARNRATHASDWRDNNISVLRSLNGAKRTGLATTNQIDSFSLRSAVEWAERMFRVGSGQESALSEPDDIHTPPVDFVYLKPTIWSDATYAQSEDDRSMIVRTLITGAEEAGMLSAGYIAVEAVGTMVNGAGLSLYAPQTIAQCSLTVRDPDGTGSGWAGASSYDWTRFDPRRVAAIALDKCLRSRNPVAIEPGRYTLILEPQAVFGLVEEVMKRIQRVANENPRGPFYLRTERVQTHPYGVPQNIGITKMGSKIMDERLTIGHDLTDPDLGVVPFDRSGEPFMPVKWVDNGVLVNLSYDRPYALGTFHENLGHLHSGSFRISGGTTSVDEMISTTKRGLVVTRFSKIQVLHHQSLLCTGVTRDGLWLVENGKISKAVKNLRFTESPLFVLNQIDQLGIPVPVFSPGRPAIIPPMKVRDFSFTSLIDAV